MTREKVVLVVTKTMKNPRSALCKTSIMAASDIFNAFGDKLLEPSTSDAFDGMVLWTQFSLTCDFFFFSWGKILTSNYLYLFHLILKSIKEM